MRAFITPSNMHSFTTPWCDRSMRACIHHTLNCHMPKIGEREDESTWQQAQPRAVLLERIKCSPPPRRSIGTREGKSCTAPITSPCASATRSNPQSTLAKKRVHSDVTNLLIVEFPDVRGSDFAFETNIGCRAIAQCRALSVFLRLFARMSVLIRVPVFSCVLCVLDSRPGSAQTLRPSSVSGKVSKVRAGDSAKMVTADLPA